MMEIVKKAKEIREKYPKGTRLVLTADMNDPYGKHKGDTGTVSCVDDMGQIHMIWDNGGSLAIVPSEDSFEVIS